MDLLIERINKALQIHCQHVSVQMCHTMRLDHTQNGDLLGSRDQAQNLSGCCVKVSITELTVPRFSCLSGSPESSFPPLSIPPLPLLWRKLNISGLHQHALLFSAPWLFPFLSLPGIEKLSSAHPWSVLYKTHTMTMPFEYLLNIHDLQQIRTYIYTDAFILVLRS